MKASKTQKRTSLNCFASLRSRFKRKQEEEIDVNLNLFNDQKMSSPFRTDNDLQSNSSSNLSANQLVIKPIKSLNTNATGSGRNKVELKPGHR